ncbi:Uncharacterized protein TPAR_03801 [Tolypocladium paradoxum]|uniref:Bifunctional cytochrome P450/NADPH--P450 reductase n=1 Tax=Tolypocladium paradoxum TaxID=94208 RepID=A0A2S4L0R7_9HYPO|nr:Uncharacterized protein TPAR_03801 [Tolypocladium paradoxum]
MIHFGSSREVMVVGRKVAEELCDETRFCKLPGGAIGRMRRVVGHGLFTAETADPRWASAHRVITPLFGPMRIRAMMEDMKDICSQMCLRWARFGPDTPIDVCPSMTKLTLDTLALCTVDYRFNSFYKGQGVEDPFAEAVVDLMTEALVQSNLPDWVNNWVRFRSMNKFHRQADELRHAIQELIQARRDNPVDRDDLLNAMLTNPDPKTGQRLSDESVVDNLLTFFIAGHETTSSLLSFCCYYLLEHPDVLRKAQAEVDAVVGDSSMTVEHLQKLPYLEAIMRETLRLRDPGPGFYVKPLRDDVLAGKYLVKKDQPIFIVFDSVHRDPEVYGDNADEFQPERMSQDKFDKLPPCAWKPFGNGMRACIGRPFAMQQAMLAIAMVLQNFDLIKDESYKLKVHVTMTVRPVGLTMKVRLRDGRRATDLAVRQQQASSAAASATLRPTAAGSATGTCIIHASNSGTSEALASRLANDAAERGVGIGSIHVAKDAIAKLPRGVPVVIITASYNGEPADDAVDFVAWLESLEEHALDGVNFAVFGCGHRDWASTFLAVPRLIDSMLVRSGAERIAPMGISDMGGPRDVFSDFEDWTGDHLFPKLDQTRQGPQPTPLAAGVGAGDADLQVSLGQPPRVAMRKGFVAAVVTEARPLSAPGVPEKRHLELRLPEGFTYKAGHHLHVLPRNSSADVQRVLHRFGLEAETLVSIRSAKRNVGSGLPLDTPIMASELLGAYVELGRTASPKNIQVLADSVDEDTDPGAKEALLGLAGGDQYVAEVQDRRGSVLDLLERFPEAKLSLSSFLSMLVATRPRAYSFSSAPGWKLGHGTLTYTVVGSGSPSVASSSTEAGPAHQDHDVTKAVVVRQGLASSYLSTLAAGSVLYVSLHPSSPDFHLPEPASRPVIMVAAGTGLAPFMGFLQERKLSLAADRQQQRNETPFGKAVLFFGCRGRALDSLYADELASFEADGLVMVRRAYSRDPAAAGAKGCRYVDERLAASGDELVDLWRSGASVLVCGGKKMANGVFKVLGPLFWEADKRDGKTTAGDVAGWRAAMEKCRYVEEVFV